MSIRKRDKRPESFVNIRTPPDASMSVDSHFVSRAHTGHYMPLPRAKRAKPAPARPKTQKASQLAHPHVQNDIKLAGLYIGRRRKQTASTFTRSSSTCPSPSPLNFACYDSGQSLSVSSFQPYLLCLLCPPFILHPTDPIIPCNPDHIHSLMTLVT